MADIKGNTTTDITNQSNTPAENTRISNIPEENTIISTTNTEDTETEPEDELPTPISDQDILLHNIIDGTPDISNFVPTSRQEVYLKHIAMNTSHNENEIYGTFKPRFAYINDNGVNGFLVDKLAVNIAHYVISGPFVYLNIYIKGNYIHCNGSTSPPMVSAGEKAYLLIGREGTTDHDPLPDEIIPKFPTFQSCRVPMFYTDYYDPNYVWQSLSSYPLYSDDWGAVTIRESYSAFLNTYFPDSSEYGYIALYHNNGLDPLDFAQAVNQRPDNYKYRLDIRFNMVYQLKNTPDTN